MRYRSNKQQKLYRDFTPIRNQYLLEQSVCADPRCCRQCTAVHEILAGSYRMEAFKHRSCWLALCDTCHTHWQSTDLATQLAIKLISDPEGFDLVDFHDVWGRPTTAITADEVIAAYIELVTGGERAA